MDELRAHSVDILYLVAIRLWQRTGVTIRQKAPDPWDSAVSSGTAQSKTSALMTKNLPSPGKGFFPFHGLCLWNAKHQVQILPLLLETDVTSGCVGFEL